MNNLLSNVAHWVTTGSSNAPLTITVSNGFPPLLTIEVQEYIPIDSRPLEHIIWRAMETETTPRRARSSPFGLILGSLDVQVIDSYLDQIVPYVIEKVAKGSTPLLGAILLRAYFQSQRKDWAEGAVGVSTVLSQEMAYQANPIM